MTRKRRARLPPSALKPPPRSVMKPPPVITVKPPPSGTPPNPRPPQPPRDSRSGRLGDLFVKFADLPWPTHSGRRLPLKMLARRLRRSRDDEQR